MHYQDMSCLTRPAVLLNEKSLVESRKVIPSVPVSSMVCMLPFFCAAKI